MERYIYGGASCNLGRFGPVAKGQVLELTTDEGAIFDARSDVAPFPTRSKVDLHKTEAYTVVAADTGKRIVSAHGATATTYTLPTAPAVGFNIEFQFGPGASADLTIDPGEDVTIDGAATATIEAADIAAGYYWNGVEWKAF